MSDFKRYANMFYSYKSVSVWSPPESLKAPKKRQDPTWQMDSYSFGMVMWELFFEKVPFDGDLRECIEYVVKEDARPRIMVYEEHSLMPSDSVHDSIALTQDQDALKLTEGLANIIRRCWQSDISQRIPMATVAQLLLEQKQLIFEDAEDQTEVHQSVDI